VKDERVYLLHAIEAIDAIQKYTADGERLAVLPPREAETVRADVACVLREHPHIASALGGEKAQPGASGAASREKMLAGGGSA
jgi:hypothetical protein